MMQQEYDPSVKEKKITQSEVIENRLQKLLEYSIYLKNNTKEKLDKFLDTSNDSVDGKEERKHLHSKYFESLNILIYEIHSNLVEVNYYLEKFDT